MVDPGWLLYVTPWKFFSQRVYPWKLTEPHKGKGIVFQLSWLSGVSLHGYQGWVWLSWLWWLSWLSGAWIIMAIMVNFWVCEFFESSSIFWCLRKMFPLVMDIFVKLCVFFTGSTQGTKTTGNEIQSFKMDEIIALKPLATWLIICLPPPQKNTSLISCFFLCVYFLTSQKHRNGVSVSKRVVFASVFLSGAFGHR